MPWHSASKPGRCAAFRAAHRIPARRSKLLAGFKRRLGKNVPPPSLQDRSGTRIGPAGLWGGMGVTARPARRRGQDSLGSARNWLLLSFRSSQGKRMDRPIHRTRIKRRSVSLPDLGGLFRPVLAANRLAEPQARNGSIMAQTPEVGHPARPGNRSARYRKHCAVTVRAAVGAPLLRCTVERTLHIDHSGRRS